MMTTICKSPRFTNLIRSHVIKTSCTAIVAGTLFVCVASVSLWAQAQVEPRRPVQKPEIPPIPQQSNPQAPVYMPPAPYQQVPMYQQVPTYQQGLMYQPGPGYQQSLPQLGSNCYAGQVMGSLAQLAPIGAPCSVFAYGMQYSGVVGQ
jgi:hypothetical protein